MRNIRLLIAYDGTDFHGWQRQPHAPTVQSLIEERLKHITGQPVTLYGSSRTDAGVHASGQVANFKTECPIPCENLVKALNHLLPIAVRVRKAQEVSQTFHARLDARLKIYRYVILQAPICSPFLGRFVCHHPYALDFDLMSKAAQLFEGEHDFTSFAGSDGSAHRNQNPRRNGLMVRKIHLSRLWLRKRPPLLVYEVRGSGFLNHMVRNMVGTLIEVGSRKIAPEEIGSILKARDRNRAGPTAPAQGLRLVRVEYDEPKRAKRDSSD